jgi:hypothetical protein
MRLASDGWLRITRLTMFCLIVFGLAMAGHGQAVGTTTVQGTVYLANGQPGGGTLTVSWPAFTTAAGQMVAADRTSVTIGNDGFVSINLAPNQGSLPAGEYYTAVFYMSDGSVNTQYWVVPAAAQATLAQIQAQVMPAAQAVQAVSKAYVDEQIAELTGSLLTASGGNLSGPLYLNGDPTQPLQAADKHYVDSEVATAVPLAGGTMNGPLATPGVNGVEAPVGAQQTTLQAAVNAAGTNGAMEIPPTYAGTDSFTNPNGVRVTDMRTNVAQQVERSVKEFGAVCDGITDDTNALQSAINYAQAHGVALTIPEGTCKTRTLNWHGESIGGLGKQVSALMGFPGQDVLATTPDSPNILSYTRLHDLTIYVDQSQDVSCSPAEGRAAAGSCQVNRPMESNTIFSPGGNGLKGTAGSGAAWAIGNCAIAMQATTGAGGNGLKNAQIENLEIVATGTDPMAAQYSGAHSTHTCGIYLAQWPQWSEFKNIDIRGLNTGVAIPALPVTAPAGLIADSNRWQNITLQATHGFTAAAGCNGILDDVTAMAGNSAATGEPPTGIILDLQSSQEGWTVRNAVVIPNWNAVQPALTVTAATGAVTGVTVGADHGLGWDPYGTNVPVAFSGSCTAQANATVNNDGSIGAISVTQGGSGCSSTTTASINEPGTWVTAAPVNLIGGQNMTFFAGSLLRGHGGYTVWNATGAQSYGTQVNGGGGNLPGGGSYPAFIANNSVGSTLQVDQFPGVDFGAKLQACVNAVNTNFGGTCDARNFTGSQTMSANLTISTPNTNILLPCATITTADQVIVTAGTRNVALRGCAMRGGSAASGSQGGTAFAYSGTGAVVEVGDPTYAVDTPGFHMDNSVINTTGAANATAQGLITFRTQEIDLEDMYFLGNSNQTGMTLDGTGNYAGGTIRSVQFSGFKTAVNAIGHQVANPATTDWMNASTFVRLHVDCPTSNGSPIAGTTGINLQQGDGNTFTGGDVEGCATALHLGSNAQNNTIIGLRNENSMSQVVADAGSSYNNWITGGTMFTGQLTDNGTRNSFQDSFHRSFNGMNGDWYGSQQDATVTNHFRLGTGAGNERGLLNEYQTDFGYRWTEGLSDATGGEQFYQILDQMNNVYRLSIGQYNNGQSSTNNQTAMNSAGTGAVVLNSTSNSGTGGVIFGSGGASPSTVATISNNGNAQFNGTLQVGGTAQSTGTLTVRNNADAEVDYYLWPGLTASQKGSFTYKDWNGNSQWYMVKDASNNWALNSALGGLDSFKAYQSTNSGDTYVNASNSSGHIRFNYETGSGAETDIYSGSSSNLVASFLGPTSVKLPGLAASTGHNCLQIDNSGYITNTGVACGSGNGNGTVSTGTSGQIAYYTTSGTSIAGVSAVPVTAGGTGSTSAAGAVTNLLPGVATDGSQGVTVTGNVAANTITASNATNSGPGTEVVNLNNLHNATLVPVTEYGAVGNCTNNGAITACTDNSTAIQNAINHCYTANCAVYFPANPASTNQTVYYTSQAINPKGVSLSGPPGAGGSANSSSASIPVAVRGAPGKDVFAVGDPDTTINAGYVAPHQNPNVRNLGIIVDDTVNASTNFPNRLPGRTCYDGTIASGNLYQLNSSAQCVFQGGDTGQSIVVYGAGTQACPSGSGSTCLVTTVAGYTSLNQITLAAPATSTVSSAQVYVSVDGLPVTQSVGNCAYSYDSHLPSLPATPQGPITGVFEDVIISTTSGSPLNNYSCGFFFQGREGPYQTLWSHDYVGAVFPFVAATAPGNSSNQPTSTISNGFQDYNVFEHTWLTGSYSFITYGGGFENFRDVQISDAEYGPSFIRAYGLESTSPSHWYIDIPEIELNYSSSCTSGWTNFRLAGDHNTVERLGSQYCSPANLTLQMDSSDTEIRHFMNASVNNINTTGQRSRIKQTYTNGQTLAWNDTGFGNTYVTERNVGSLDSIEPMRDQYAGGNSAAIGPPTLAHDRSAFERTGDFLNKGGGAYYLNDFDLWMWPYELGNLTGGGSPQVVSDSTSQTGTAVYLPAGFTQSSLGESNGTFWTIGSQIPAAKLRVFFSIKTATSGTLLNFDVQRVSGGVGTSLGCSYATTGASLTPTYTVYYCDVDTSSYSGQGFAIHLGSATATTANIQIAWIGVRVWDSGTVTTALQVAQTGTAMTGNQGNGAEIQHSTGLINSGDLTSFDANGNTVDSSISKVNVAQNGGAMTPSSVTASGAIYGTLVTGLQVGPSVMCDQVDPACNYADIVANSCTLDVALNACNSQVLQNGGGTADARNLGGLTPLSIAHQVNVGGIGVNVTLTGCQQLTSTSMVLSGTNSLVQGQHFSLSGFTSSTCSPLNSLTSAATYATAVSGSTITIAYAGTPGSFVPDAATLTPAHESVELLLPPQADWQVTDTTSTDCGIMQFSSTSVVGEGGSGDTIQTILDLGTGANIDSLYCTAPASLEPADYIYARGFRARNNLPAYNSATTAHGLFHIQNVADEGYFGFLNGLNYWGDSMDVDGSCCGTVFDHLTMFGNEGTVSGIPLKVGEGIFLTVNFIGNSATVLCAEGCVLSSQYIGVNVKCVVAATCPFSGTPTVSSVINTGVANTNGFVMSSSSVTCGTCTNVLIYLRPASPPTVSSTLISNSSLNYPGQGSPSLLITGGSNTSNVKTTSIYMEGNAVAGDNTPYVIIDTNVVDTNVQSLTADGGRSNTKTLIANYSTAQINVNDLWCGGIYTNTAIYDFSYATPVSIACPTAPHEGIGHYTNSSGIFGSLQLPALSSKTGYYLQVGPGGAIGAGTPAPAANWGNGYVSQLFSTATGITTIHDLLNANCSGQTINSITGNFIANKYTSGAASGDCGGFSGTAGFVAASYPTETFVFEYTTASDYANARGWWGMYGLGTGSCAFTSMTGSDTPACPIAAIRYSTSAGDSDFMCVASTGSAQATASLGLAPAAGVTWLSTVTVNAAGVTCTMQQQGGTLYSATVPTDAPAGHMATIMANTVPSGSTAVNFGFLWSTVVYAGAPW